MKAKTFGLPVLIVGLLLFAAGSSALWGADAAVKIRVVASRANVRSAAELTSSVLTTAEQGAVFTADKSGDWYVITLATGQKGYLHTSVVEEVPENVAPRVNTPVEKPAAPPVRRPDPTIRPTAPRTVPVAASSLMSKRLFLRVGGAYTSKAVSYGNSWGFDLYYEQGRVAESYSLDSSGLTIDAGIGFYVIPNLGLELSFVPASGKISGAFDAAFPHPFYFDFYREAQWENSGLKFSSPELNLNLIARFEITPKLQAYLSGGGTYFLGVEIESLESIGYDEVAYPYSEISVTPEYATYKQKVFGFNGGAGLDFFFTGNIGLNANFRYTVGEAKIAVEGAEYAIKAGGIRASLGLKVVL
jgi:opacity protein-like surface antigen